MVLNKQKGNMYPWVTHTWNPIKGKCSHNCKYCFMKRFPLNPVRLDESELNTDLGQDNTIFIGSSCDMWAKDIPTEWVGRVLEHCENYLDNSYLFQTKNPRRFIDIQPDYLNTSWSKRVIIGTTIETNRDCTFSWEYAVSNAPNPMERFEWLNQADAYHKMVSIEPIMDFDLYIFIACIRNIRPDFVSIGADSKGHNLPEPNGDKIEELISELSKFTEVKVKSNLSRLTKVHDIKEMI